MASDKFKFDRVRIDEITVGERQRKDLGDLSGLRDTIDDLELLQPIVITRDKRLIVGERRLRTHQKLGREYIYCMFTDEVDPHKLKEMQFVENDQRLGYTWQERCDAVVDYHEGRLPTDRNWTKKQTAKRLNVSETLVCDYLGIDELHKKGHTELKVAADSSTARTRMRHIKERAADAENEEMDEFLSDLIDGYKVAEKSEIPIITADFLEWAPAYTGSKFNFLHCDFPYGINTDQRQQGNAVAIQGGFDDDPDTYWRLLEALCKNLDRICADSAHIMFWFAMECYHDTLEYFAKHSDFKFRDPRPLIWHKSDGKGLLPDPNRGPRCVYETALFGSRGDRLIVSSVANLYPAPTDSSQHISAKPEPMLRHFFRMFVDENSKVLDPTCGSGTALRAAKVLGAAYVLGIEKDKDFAERATRSFRDWLVANGNGQVHVQP
jgi:ParB-like chromosome segregation protein Spo0J